MSRAVVLSGLVATVAANSCTEGPYSEATCTGVTGCAWAPKNLCYGSQTAACGTPAADVCPTKLNCFGYAADQELTCKHTSCSVDPSSYDCIALMTNAAGTDYADFADADCKEGCGVIEFGECTGDVGTDSPTDTPMTVDATCGDMQTVATCIAMAGCVAIEATIAGPCDDYTGTSIRNDVIGMMMPDVICAECSDLLFSTNDKDIVAYMGENTGKEWSAENADASGTYKVSLKSVDISSCADTYKTGDSSGITEVDLLNYAMESNQNLYYATSIPSDRVITTTVMPTDEGAAATVSCAAVALLAALFV